MSTTFTIRKAAAEDVPGVTAWVGELLEEIMSNIGEQAFNFDVVGMASRLVDFPDRGMYYVFVAGSSEGKPARIHRPV
ncbi:MAG: hypothetical protein K9G39_03320 [Chlorobium sp.]|uniref:hypothetical protein n=1 Tax=Chlorobium sp. TaxID=1095 RepID=UPI0025C114FF|nr:hypothetical protein [Chlorobium sp.]MCF8382614.1 hypothetical protein [Chlorobium sp.]